MTMEVFGKYQTTSTTTFFTTTVFPKEKFENSEREIAHFASIMVNHKALVVALVMLVGANSTREFTKKFGVSTFCDCMHGGTHIVHHAYNSNRIL